MPRSAERLAQLWPHPISIFSKFSGDANSSGLKTRQRKYPTWRRSSSKHTGEGEGQQGRQGDGS